MIAAYAQAHRHHGLVAAVDEKMIGLDDNDLMLLRQKSARLNLTKAPLAVGNTELRIGRGIVRLEILANVSDHAIQSPIVLVIEIAELETGAEDVARRALTTVAAIERTCEVDNLTEALATAQLAIRTARMKRNIALGLEGTAVAVTLVYLCYSPIALVWTTNQVATTSPRSAVIAERKYSCLSEIVLAARGVAPLFLAMPVVISTIGPMTDTKIIENSGNNFTRLLDAAAKLPGVRIDRATYLRTSLQRYCTADQIEIAVNESPAAAGIPLSIITQAANTSIKYETSKVTGLSTVAGLPGGLAMIGTVPADLVQYMGHMLRIAQKLAYLHSWPELFTEGEEVDEATESVLTLFVGVMFGLQIAQGGVAKVAGMMAANVAKKLPQQALTKGLIYPVVKKVAGYLGVSMTKKLFASGVAKAIPVVGAVLSGSLTLATFLPMSKRLQKHLASLELTKPGHRAEGSLHG